MHIFLGGKRVYAILLCKGWVRVDLKGSAEGKHAQT